MSAYLASLYPTTATEPSKFDSFFEATEEIPKIGKFVKKRECESNTFPPACTVNLSFGFFFDGTNNNLKRDRKSNAHSNVARLYEAFPGAKEDPDSNNESEAWPNFKAKYHNSFFRTYIPGAGTKFDYVKDSGEGLNPLLDDRSKGLAFCYLGENRIIWALVEAINNVHFYYKDSKLIDKAAFQKKFNKLTLPSYKDRFKTNPRTIRGQQQPPSDVEKFVKTFTQALRDLHESIKAYVPVGTGKVLDHGKVVNIYASMFGFSRGAAEARAYSNWFVWLCEQDAIISKGSGLSLGTIPVTIDFLGLFDTVASVGVAATAKIANGHQSWADTESSLKIPSEPKQCLHLVSGHEIRRSFPLDSVCYRGVLPDNCIEKVYPGVHSDIGGGYQPLEQGRSIDPEGADMLSRITLATMYRAARLAGVPLKLEEAPESVKRSFKIAPGLIEKFNAYISKCNDQFLLTEAGKPKAVPLQDLMAQQHQLYILWRKAVVGTLGSKPNLVNSQYKDAKFDITDITEADAEMAKEMKNFEKWRADPNPKSASSLDEPAQALVFNPEWPAINKYWSNPIPASAVTDFFELVAHDSRAWFKPFGKDIPDLISNIEKLEKQKALELDWDANHVAADFNPYRLTEKQSDQVLLYSKTKGTTIALVPDKDGREPITGSLIIVAGGYLRYRRIYMGSDSYKPSGAQYAGLAPVHINAMKKEYVA